MSGAAQAVALEPEISVTGNGTSIVNGDMVPTADDHTDFGDVPAKAESVVRTFTIHNDGTAALQPGPVKVSGGVPASEFTVSQQPALSVPPGESTTFQISCQPSLLGLRTATVSFSSNDVDEAVFSFAIRAQSSGPQPSVSGNGLEISHADRFPRVEDNTDFGKVAVGATGTTHTFTLKNIGSSDLMAGEVLFKAGNYNSFFSLTRAPASVVPPGGSTTFDVTFTPTIPILASANVWVITNGVNTPTYAFDIQGWGGGPEIAVQGDYISIVNGDNTPAEVDKTDFGNVTIATSRSHSFSMRNFGGDPLTLGGISITGDHANDFSIVQYPNSPVTQAEMTFLTIRFKPAGLGIRSAIISIGNNDYDENPFRFSIQGTGTNLAPTDISLSKSNIGEGNFPGTAVGTLTATDPDAGQTLTFSLVAGDGAEGNDAFAISGNLLLAKVATDFETQNSYSIRVRATDNANPPLEYEEILTITVTDVNEAALQIAQKAFLKGSNTQAGDWFGLSVAVSGNTVVVGAMHEDSSSAGVNSLPDEGCEDSGAAYVFVRDGGGWTQQAYLKAANPGIYDRFGRSVDISGDTIVVGAALEGSSTKGVNSVPDDAAPGAGAAYIFTRHQGEWTQQAYLKASNTGADDNFGSAVAISGDVVIVGATKEDSSSTGVNSVPNENVLNSGAAYIFARTAGVWVQQAYLKAADVRKDDFAGGAVAISGETAIMSSRTLPISSSYFGRVSVFTRTGTTWSYQSALAPAGGEAYDQFGSALAISGNTVVVGAIEEDGSSPGVNGPVNNNALGSGAAYVFTRVGTAWAQQAYLKASSPRAGDRFGSGVAVSGDTVVVGAMWEDNSGVGVNSLSAYGTDNSGAAFVFRRTGTTWSEQAYLKAHNTGTEDLFGWAIALSGDSVIIGSHKEDSSIASLSGLTDDLATDAGAAYVYSLPPSVELAVFGNNASITDGDITPSPADHTLFGDVSAGLGSLTRTFVLQNMGTAPLTLDSLVISGAHAGDFTLSSTSTTSLVGGDVMLLEVTFNPSALGTRNATLSFNSNDADEGAFNFTLQGTGVDAEIELTGNSSSISSGDASPSLANGTEFGKVVRGGMVERTFTIRNTGTASLVLSDVGISGQDASSFTITQAPSSSVAIGAGTVFTLRFNPQVTGVHHATVSFTTNDPDEQEFNFAVWGQGVLGAPAAQTVAFSPPTMLFVSHGPVMLSASASSGLPVTLTRMSGPATLAGNVLNPTGVGTVTITATQAGDGSFKAVSITKTILIKPLSMLTLVDLSQTYNGTPRPIRMLGATGVPVITYTVDRVSTNIAPVNAGTYPVKVVVDGKTLTGILVIARMPLQVATDSHRRFIGQANPALTVTYSGFVGNDTESSVFAQPGAKRPVLKTTATATSAGGLYPITASGAVMGNYVPVYANGQMLVETFAGAYEGLLTGTDTLPAAKVEFTVTANSTALSGKLTVPGEVAPLPFNGTLTVNGDDEKATGAIKPVTKNGKTYAVTFDLPFGADFESQMRVGDLLTAETNEGKKIYTAPAGMPIQYLGSHTMILAPALPASPDVPAGCGHATATIDKKRVLKIAGRLADGTTLTASLQPDGHDQLGYRLFAQPYARAGSYLAGWLDFEDHPGPAAQRYIPASAGCDLAWAKVGRTTDKSYRDDFGPVLTRVTVDPWIVPSKTSTLALLLGLSGTSTFDLAHSGFASASFGNLPVEVTLTAANKLVVTQATNSTKWTATITPSTGAFAGSFEISESVNIKRTVPFTGVLRQPHGTGGPLGAGHALVPALPTDLTNETISGAIQFDP